jgi:hypothetical protein
MQTYIGTKVINAKPMNRQEYNDFRGWELPSDEDGSDEGYLVEYVDGGQANTEQYAGYVSWSPKDVFERAYNPNGSLTFGDALVLLKQGKRVSRAGWNGKGMFVYMVLANSYPAQTDADRDCFGEIVLYNPYMAIKNVDHTVSTWVPSVNDALAEDWHVID